MSGFNRVHGKTSRGMILQSCMGMLAALTSSGVLMQCGGCPLFPSTPLTVNAGVDQTLASGASGSVTATTANESGDVSFTWEIISGPATIGVDTNATVTVACGATAGTTVLRVTATDSNCTAVDEVAITCSATPPPPPPPSGLNVNAGADTTAVQGQTIVLTATVTGGEAPVSFSWLVTPSGTGSASILNANTQTPSVTFSEDALGVFTFSVNITDNNGDTDSDTVSVTVGVAPPVPDSLEFTLNADDLTGSSGEDAFTAPLLFNAPTATLIPTLQSVDAADGLGGNDSLEATINDEGGATITPLLSGIEVQNYTVLDTDMTIDATNITGATAINTINSSADLTVDNLNNLAGGGISNTSNDLELNFTAEAVEGTADALSLSLNAADSTFTSSGIETANIDSAGTEDNILDLDLGADLTGINVTGPAALDLDDLGVNNPNVEALDASGSTGGVTLTAPPTDFSFFGGSGDDRVDFAAGQLTGLDTANGAGGTDTLGLANADAVALSLAGDDLTGLSNFEALVVTDGISGDIDLPLFNATTLVAEAGVVGASTITVESGNTVTVQADSAGAVTLAGGTGVADSANLNLEDADLSGGLILDEVETVNLNVTEGASTILSVGGTPSDPAGTAIGHLLLNVTGDQDVTITSADADLETINASALTGDLTVVVATTVITITGGSGDDNLTGSTSGDSIAGGAGADSIDGAAGGDDLAGGAGADTYEMAALGSLDAITMEAGDIDGSAIDDIFDFASNFDLVGAAPSVVVVSDTDITAGANSGVAAGDNVIILTGDSFADAAALVAATTELTAGAGDVVIIYSGAAGDAARIAIATVDAGGDVTAAEDLAVLPGLTVAEAATGFADGNFTSD